MQMAYAGLRSPFTSSVDGISTPNTHFVDHSERVLRGMRPDSIEELIEFGITDVLIFKHQTKKEVSKEITELKALGYGEEQITHIPFKWRQFDSYKVACLQTIKALRILKEVYQDSSRKVFFHCTVGEDRTGHLAGLWRMLSDSWSKKDAFYNEMCKNGYSRGNSRKPYKVTNSIDRDLTPLFLHMATKIENGELSLDNLTNSICSEKSFLIDTSYRCR
ncbi:hypothetical protein [Flavobacterium alkalisoli]|uniref:hypothetical protein n=1 Tax=Flavobacterium alkalisoli TaxID=2602769 RepID=UPI003A951988